MDINRLMRKINRHLGLSTLQLEKYYPAIQEVLIDDTLRTLSQFFPYDYNIKLDLSTADGINLGSGEYIYYIKDKYLESEPDIDIISVRQVVGAGNIEVPDDITAGDTISIVHTGSITTLETYPGQSYLRNGEVISYSFNYAEVIHLEGENYSVEAVKSNYSHRYYRPYVILDRSGRYISLDNYTGDELYLVVDEVRGKNSDMIEEDIPEGMIPVACMLAYNPRDLEDGIPGEMYVPPLISEEAAVALASEYFYNKFDYELPPKGYEYKAEIVEHWNTSYYHVLFSLVYVADSSEAILDNAVSYTISVSKALNEISMITVNR